MLESKQIARALSYKNRQFAFPSQTDSLSNRDFITTPFFVIFNCGKHVNIPFFAMSKSDGRILI